MLGALVFVLLHLLNSVVDDLGSDGEVVVADDAQLLADLVTPLDVGGCGEELDGT